MDCGGGTYEQFRYHYSPDVYDRRLMELKIIFITHLHADHNLGILEMIQQRNILIKGKAKSTKNNLSENK